MTTNAKCPGSNGRVPIGGVGLDHGAYCNECGRRILTLAGRYARHVTTPIEELAARRRARRRVGYALGSTVVGTGTLPTPFHPHGPDGGLGRPDARDAVADDEGEDLGGSYSCRACGSEREGCGCS